MRIYPVIDLKEGSVVHAVAGRREQYRPLVSSLCRGSTPAAVADALVERFAASALYVADLDAIGGAEPNWSALRDIGRDERPLLVDAGVDRPARARRLIRYLRGPIDGIVVGLESIAGPDSLARVVDILRDRLVFSIDLRGGRTVARWKPWRRRTAAEIARRLPPLGIDRAIVLDLTRVGTGQGTGTEATCRRLRRDVAALRLFAGGGVRGPDDLQRLAGAGCDGVLVASALHDGRMTREDFVRFDGRASARRQGRQLSWRRPRI